MLTRSEVNVPGLPAMPQLGQMTFPVSDVGISRMIVVDVMDDVIVVQGGDGGPFLRANCSASCLLNPRPDDQVLVHIDYGSQEHFVLSVLKQSEKNLKNYAFSKDVNLIVDGNNVHLIAHSINLTAAESEFRIDQFKGVYSDKSERANTITVVANQVRQQIDRMIAKIRNSFRIIDGLDRTQAANIQQTAEHQILLKSSFTKLRSQYAVKVDAKKIDLG